MRPAPRAGGSAAARAPTVNLEDCSGCGVRRWGWQDNGWGVGVSGPPIYFASTGPHTIRVTTREDGISIDQIVLVGRAGICSASPGALKNDHDVSAADAVRRGSRCRVPGAGFGSGFKVRFRVRGFEPGTEPNLNRTRHPEPRRPEPLGGWELILSPGYHAARFVVPGGRMNASRVLVVGATGQLGGVIARKLISSGTKVRALARNREALERCAPDAEIAAVDLRDLAKLTEACRGVDQIVATANNNMGKGATSPTRVDLGAYQNLCAAARNTGVRRLTYVSYKGLSQDACVDIFRVKWYIEDAIRRSGIPYVMLRPTMFMEIWIDQLLGKAIREKGVATIFGDGNTVSNYVSVDDVAEFATRILARPEVVNEVVDAGGPSNLSQNDVATLVERRLGSSGKRRHLPVAALRLLPPVVRPFNEVAARLMTLGLYRATEAVPFPGWKASADRFGVAPRTVETHVERMA